MAAVVTTAAAAGATGEDLRTGGGDRASVLGVRRARAVGRPDRPAVVVKRDLVGAGAPPWLDGDRQAGLELHAATAAPVVGHVRRLVHGAAETVAAELEVDTVAVATSDVTDRGRDVADPASGAGRGDARRERHLGGLDQLQVGRVRRADD